MVCSTGNEQSAKAFAVWGKEVEKMVVPKLSGDETRARPTTTLGMEITKHCGGGNEESIKKSPFGSFSTLMQRVAGTK